MTYSDESFAVAEGGRLFECQVENFALTEGSQLFQCQIENTAQILDLNACHIAYKITNQPLEIMYSV